MEKVWIDAGHGGRDSGAQGNGIKEAAVTLALAKAARDYLVREYDNVEVRLSREEDTSMSLAERTQAANKWGAAVLLSIHINSAAQIAEGFESFVYTGVNARTKSLQNVLHRKIAAVIGFKDRGQKQANFHMLRESAMPAVLTECGFINNPAEARFMNNPEWLLKVSRAHAEGLAEWLGLKKKAAAPAAAKPAAKLWRVQVGAYEDRNNAEKLLADLQRSGYKPYIVEE